MTKPQTKPSGVTEHGPTLHTESLSKPRQAFLSTWQSSESVVEVAKRLGLTQGTCHTMAYKLRSQGYALKMMPKGRPRGETAPEAAQEARAETLAKTLDLLPQGVKDAMVASARAQLLLDAEMLGKLEAKRIETRRRESGRLRKRRT